METLISAIRIQEQHLENDLIPPLVSDFQSKTNIVEGHKTHKNPLHQKSKFNKGKTNYGNNLKPKSYINKDDKRPICFNCNKPGHLAKNCRYKKRKYQGNEQPRSPNPQAHMVLSGTDSVGTDERYVTISLQVYLPCSATD